MAERTLKSKQTNFAPKHRPAININYILSLFFSISILISVGDRRTADIRFLGIHVGAHPRQFLPYNICNIWIFRCLSI